MADGARTAADAPVIEAGAATDTERLTVRVLLAYCVAQFGFSALNTLMNTSLPFFYMNTLEVSGAVFGWIMLTGKLWDAVTDPLMGHITDNTRWRVGRRRPFFVLGAPFLGLGIWLMFRPPAGLTGNAVVPWFLGTFLLVYTSRTVFETPYQAMIPDMTADYDERTRLAVYRATIGNMGDLLGAILPVVLGIIGIAVITRLRLSGGIVGIIVVTTAAFALFGTRERTRVAHLPKKPFWSNIRAIVMFPVRNRPARILILSYACAVFATAMPVASFKFVNEFVFVATGLEDTFLGPVVESFGKANFLNLTVLLSYFAGVFTGAPIWMRAMRARDKKPAYIFAFLYLGSMVAGLFFIPRHLGVLFCALNFMVGAGALGLWMLPQAIGPDCIEWEELHHGDRHEGGFYGIWSLVQKTGSGFALLTMGFLMEFIGFIPKAAQSDTTILGLRFLYGGTPVIICVIGAVMFSRYPITRAMYEDIMRQLAARRRDDPPAP